MSPRAWGEYVPLMGRYRLLQQEFENFHIWKLPSYTKMYIVYGLVWSLSYLIWKLLGFCKTLYIS